MFTISEIEKYVWLHIKDRLAYGAYSANNADLMRADIEDYLRMQLGAGIPMPRIYCDLRERPPFRIDWGCDDMSPPAPAAAVRQMCRGCGYEWTGPVVTVTPCCDDTRIRVRQVR